MATTGQVVINEVRAETGELAPDKMPDLLILNWADDDTIGIFLQFIDIFQERYQSMGESAAISWGASDKWKDFALTGTVPPFFKVTHVTTKASDNTSVPVLIMPLQLSTFWGFNGNANHANGMGWIQLNENTYKIVLGSSKVGSGPTPLQVYGVRKPVLMAGVSTAAVDLPDEFVPLVKSKVKIRAFDLLGRMDKVQTESSKLAERIQGIEQSYRVVTSQATEGKPIGVR